MIVLHGYSVLLDRRSQLQFDNLWNGVKKIRPRMSRSQSEWAFVFDELVHLAPFLFTFPLILLLSILYRLPLHIVRTITSTFRKWNNVVNYISGATMRIAGLLFELMFCRRTPFDSSVWILLSGRRSWSVRIRVRRTIGRMSCACRFPSIRMHICSILSVITIHMSLRKCCLR